MEMYAQHNKVWYLDIDGDINTILGDNVNRREPLNRVTFLSLVTCELSHKE